MTNEYFYLVRTGERKNGSGIYAVMKSSKTVKIDLTLEEAAALCRSKNKPNGGKGRASGDKAA